MRPEIRWYLAAAFAIVLCYAPLVFIEYGFGEDYRLLAFYDRGFTNRTLMIAEGRPFQALWVNIIYANLPSIGALAWVRLASIVFIAGTAALYAWTWHRVGLEARLAALVAAATFSLPPFQALAAMGFAVPVLFGMLVAGAASILTESRRYVLAWLLLSVALLFYQPTAMIYWVFSAVLIFARPVAGAARRALEHAAVGFGALPVGYAAYVIGRSVYAEDLAGTDRASIAFDLPAKLAWFATEPLPVALNLWNLRAVVLLAVPLGIVIVVGLALHFHRSRRVVLFPLALGAVLLAYLPNLLTAENWPSYRSQVALSTLLVAYLVISLRTALRARLLAIALAAMTFCALISASYNVTTLFAIPQARELALVRETLRDVPLHGRPLAVRQTHWYRTLAPYVLYDEFGHSTTSFPWGVTDLPYMVLRERGEHVRAFEAVPIVATCDIDWNLVLIEQRPVWCPEQVRLPGVDSIAHGAE